MIAIGSVLIFLLVAGICGVGGTLQKRPRAIVLTAIVVMTSAAVAFVVTAETLLQRAAREHGGIKGLLIRPTSDGGESTPWAAQVERTAFVNPAVVAAGAIIVASTVASRQLRRRQDPGQHQVWVAALMLLFGMLVFALARHISTWDVFI